MLLSRQSPATNIYTSKQYPSDIITHSSEILWIKRCYTITESKPCPTIGSTHGNTAYILATGQSITIKIAHKLIIIMLILPQAHSGAYPQVAGKVLDDSAYHLIAQDLCTFEWHSLFLSVIVDIQSIVGSKQYPMVTSLAGCFYSIIVKQHFPTIRTEMVFYGVIAIDT